MEKNPSRWISRLLFSTQKTRVLLSYLQIWLVVSTPLKNMKVRLDHHPQSGWGTKKHVPNHQPEITRVIITYQIGCPGKKGELFVSYLRSLGATDQTSPSLPYDHQGVSHGGRTRSGSGLVFSRPTSFDGVPGWGKTLMQVFMQPWFL